MGIRIKEAKCTISAFELRAGEFGVITEWPHGSYAGLVVTRVDVGDVECIYSICTGDYWDIDTIETIQEDCRVQLLKPGTTLEIT